MSNRVLCTGENRRLIFNCPLMDNGIDKISSLIITATVHLNLKHLKKMQVCKNLCSGDYFLDIEMDNEHVLVEMI